MSGDREECLAATAAETAPEAKPVKPRNRPAVVKVSKKKKAKVAKAKAKTKPKTAQVAPKPPKKKVAEKISVRKAALPLIPKPGLKTNFVACPPTKPCIDHRSLTASSR